MALLPISFVYEVVGAARVVTVTLVAEPRGLSRGRGGFVLRVGA